MPAVDSSSPSDKRRGVQYYLTLDNPNPGFDSCFESSTFARASKDLQAIERHLGMKTHFDFFSYAAQNSLCPPGYEETEIPWFDPQEGIDWLASVIAHVRQHPTSVELPEKLANELAACQDILRQAKTIKARWHFEMNI